MKNMPISDNYIRKFYNECISQRSSTTYTVIKIACAAAAIYGLGRLLHYIYTKNTPPSDPPTPSDTDLFSPTKRFFSSQDLSSQKENASSHPGEMIENCRNAMYQNEPITPIAIFFEGLRKIAPASDEYFFIIRNHTHFPANFSDYFSREILRMHDIENGLLKNNPKETTLEFSFNYKNNLKISLKKVPKAVTNLLNLKGLKAHQTVLKEHNFSLEFDKELSGTIAFIEKAVIFSFHPETTFIYEKNTLVANLVSIEIPYNASKEILMNFDPQFVQHPDFKSPLQLAFRAQEWIVIFDYNIYTSQYDKSLDKMKNKQSAASPSYLKI